MNNITLVVMAAGMGSRYGGLKQLDKIGPSGETIIDYSVYDSINAGFDKVVFIIRKDFERIFKTQILKKYLNQIEVKHVFQSINDLPGDYISPSNRIKPWGTGQAILCAESEINSPFVVINADDFYGHQSFLQLYDYFNSNSHRNSNFTMIAYTLNNTLSENGSVTRGVCKVKNNFLVNIDETETIDNDWDNLTHDEQYQINKDLAIECKQVDRGIKQWL